MLLRVTLFVGGACLLLCAVVLTIMVWGESHIQIAFGRSSAARLIGPCVLAVLTWLAGTVVLAAALRPRPARNSRHCTCGYDLTGNVSGRCPECGTPIPNGDQSRSPKA